MVTCPANASEAAVAEAVEEVEVLGEPEAVSSGPLAPSGESEHALQDISMMDADGSGRHRITGTNGNDKAPSL